MQQTAWMLKQSRTPFSTSSCWKQQHCACAPLALEPVSSCQTSCLHRVLSTTLLCVLCSDIGGCKEQIEKMREVVELPMLHPEKFVQLGIDPPKGVLCYGPPGASQQQCKAPASRATQALRADANTPRASVVCFQQSGSGLGALCRYPVSLCSSSAAFGCLHAVTPISLVWWGMQHASLVSCGARCHRWCRLNCVLLLGQQ